MLRVEMSDLIAWNRPIQFGSYSVFKPKGTLTPTPIFQSAATSMAKYTFGTAERSPALPPSFPRGLAAGDVDAVEPESLNFADRLMSASPAETCIPPGSKLMPAGLEKMVLASSAAAAAPANELPRPLALCSTSANAEACACETPPAKAPATASDRAVFLIPVPAMRISS